MSKSNVFFIEKLIGDDWFRFAGAFGDYDQAFKYYDLQCSPRKFFRIARYGRIEVIDKVEE
jgi:hypothetical protein